MLEFFKAYFPKIRGKDKKKENRNITTQAHKNSLPPPPLVTTVSADGLPWDFWPILSKLPSDFDSSELEHVRQTPEYKALLSQYHLAHQAKKHPASTSTESLKALLKDI
jgi:hypothetical protein